MKQKRRTVEISASSWTELEAVRGRYKVDRDTALNLAIMLALRSGLLESTLRQAEEIGRKVDAREEKKK